MILTISIITWIIIGIAWGTFEYWFQRKVLYHRIDHLAIGFAISIIAWPILIPILLSELAIYYTNQAFSSFRTFLDDWFDSLEETDDTD